LQRKEREMKEEGIREKKKLKKWKQERGNKRDKKL